MLIKASVKYIRVSPRKVRLIANVVRGLDLLDAFAKLALLNKRAVDPIVKLLESAQANAIHNHNISKENLFVKEITANDGPTFYRWLPRAFGRATPLRRRTTYVQLVIAEKDPTATRSSVESKKTTRAGKKNSKTGIVENISSEEKKPTSEDNKPEIFDVRMQGKHRNNQHQDGRQKKGKGVFKKMFQRKTGV
jgi:large subunit ribosomal protein L22